MTDRSQFLTEQQLPESMHLDQMPIEQAVALMNDQDAIAALAVKAESANVSRAVKIVADAFAEGGRLIYAGAGTSGRLGVLDASECPPTFRSSKEMVQGIIAGGPEALTNAIEGAEDDLDAGRQAIAGKLVSGKDVVVGIAAGGTTRFVRGALEEARNLGAKTIFLTCVQPFAEEPAVDLVIRPLVGPELLAGSTRLKAGTATKLVLNQITTLAMIQLGKVYGNLMVDLRASNAKLRERAKRIVATIAGVSVEKSAELLEQADQEVKTAIVMQCLGTDAGAARLRLEQHQGHLRKTLEAR